MLSLLLEDEKILNSSIVLTLFSEQYYYNA